MRSPKLARLLSPGSRPLALVTDDLVATLAVALTLNLDRARHAAHALSCALDHNPDLDRARRCRPSALARSINWLTSCPSSYSASAGMVEFSTNSTLDMISFIVVTSMIESYTKGLQSRSG